MVIIYQSERGYEVQEIISAVWASDESDIRITTATEEILYFTGVMKPLGNELLETLFETGRADLRPFKVVHESEYRNSTQKKSTAMRDAMLSLLGVNQRP